MSFDLEIEWSFLNNELLSKQPTQTPFPKHIADARTLLLKAQVLLSLYSVQKTEEIRTDLVYRYKSTIECYHYLLTSAN